MSLSEHLSKPREDDFGARAGQGSYVNVAEPTEQKRMSQPELHSSKDPLLELSHQAEPAI